MTDDSAASAPSAPPAKPGGRQEILLRVASAVVLVPAGLWVVHAGGWWIVGGTALCAMLAAGEWVRMASGITAGPLRLLAILVMAAGAAAATYFGQQGLAWVGVAALATAGLCALLALAGKGSVPSMALGAVYLCLPFGAFVWIREAAPDGRQMLFAIMAVVWATDIAAYFAGRGFGGPLLSPKDSPNKTWTGAIGAVVCAALAGGAAARLLGGGDQFTHWILASVVLSVVAQAGDLLESRFKRLYGVKDTSGLVPGHGGVLDRLDALMAATVFAALVLQFAPGLAPGFG